MIEAWNKCKIFVFVSRLGPLFWWEPIHLTKHVDQSWMGFCPQKPHLFGNKNFTHCWAKSRIVTQIELVEGKDCLNKLPNHPYHDKGETVDPAVVFYFLPVCCAWFWIFTVKEILEMRKKVIFTGVLIKKYPYWPAMVPGNAIDLCLKCKIVGMCVD